MRRYAENTRIDEMQTRQQVECELMKKGADKIGTMTEACSVSVAFTRDNVAYRLTLSMAISEDEAKKAAYEAGKRGNGRRIFTGDEAVTKERSRRMRALLAVVKARLLAVDEGITTFEQEFMPHIICDDGQTIAERYLPEVEAAKLAGRAFKALGDGK